ncbi:serine protease [Nocardiopsis gilva YIM 90087]|uniref:Serine protease n=1 Tax=Nocardiopsis gilva YIM 90087 TaxID=1235441 RepID=A0A223S5Z1_9ACTN|nr:trypsin-like peptidase domain-containing protein [Nocardiopsis gilva]ASU83449.1 serine protease [Nocardiopsis gilva YIM 90087]
MTPDGLVAGGGVLVPGNRVLTCVHVVNVALRRGNDPAPPGPDEPISVDTPHHPGYRPVAAHVVGDTWDAGRDTTLLRLDEDPRDYEHPAAWLAARMEEVAESGSPRRVVVRGYPSGVPEGLLAGAEVVGYGGGIPGRAQLNVVDPTVSVEQGFSGCGVRDTTDGSVIGIVTTARFDAAHPHQSRVAFMEPLEWVTALRPLLVDEEFEAVKTFLLALRFEAVSAAYVAATRHRGPERADFTSAWDAFVRLRQFTPGPDDLPCEIVYLAEIAKMGFADARALQGYVESRPPWYVPRDALVRVSNEPSTPAPTGGSLIIAAEPIPGEPGTIPRYTLSHWLDDGRTITNRGSHRITEDTLRETVLQMVEDAEAQLPVWDSPASAGLRLEFILPFPLLTQQIAQWRLPSPFTGEGERIGATYEIVVHSAERFTEKRLARARRKLGERWRRLADNDEGIVHRIPPRPASPDDPPLADRLANPGIALCALGAPPRERDGTLQLYHAIEAGLPAIIWLDVADEDATRRFHGRIESFTRRNGEAISLDDVASLSRYVRSWRTRNTIGGQDNGEGYDPYDINIILDDMSHIRRLFHIGILSTPE